MSISNGVAPGIVTKINDNGTVKVKFPWLPDEPETDWVRIAAPMAGKDRGMFFMPEVEDEVLVAYQQGSVNSPYIIGFLWNGKDKAPDGDKKNRSIRRIKTKSGHKIEFDDNDGDEKIHIESQGENRITLEDKPSGKITIATKKGNFIEISDDGSGNITISTSSGSVNVECKDASVQAKNAISLDCMNATVNAKAALSLDCTTANISAKTMVNIDCITAAITAKAALNITAPMTQFTGIVQMPMIIANAGKFDAVVSGAYNPGTIGTLIGL